MRKGAGERSLLDYLQRIEGHTERGWAFHIHLSKLRSHSRAEHLLYGLDMLRSLVQQFDGRMFAMKNTDLVAVFKDPRVRNIKDGIKKVQFLFHDDPLFQMEQDPDAQFSSAYDLNNEYGEFVRLAESLAAEAAAATGETAAPAQPGQVEAGRAGEAGELAWLGSLEESLGAADLSRIVHRQPVCRAGADRELTRVFDELYVSIPDLERMLVPAAPLAADRWLFQYFTKSLDKSVLVLLTHGGASGPDGPTAAPGSGSAFTDGGDLSINLNVPSVLSPEFAAFDAALPPAVRGTIALEFQMIDVFADLGRYLYVRDYARERGYRVCLDGVSHLGLRFIDRAGLGLDLMKVIWTAEMADEAGPGRDGELRALVERAGTDRLILCRCDSERAIDFGRALGISLFQGRQIDAVDTGRRAADSFLRGLGTRAAGI